MSGPIKVCGNLAARSGRLVKGETVAGHEHNFDHLTCITAGTLLFEELDAAGEETLQSVVKHHDEAWPFLRIKKGTKHRTTCLSEYGGYSCLYPHRNEDGEIVEHYTGWEPAYA